MNLSRLRLPAYLLVAALGLSLIPERGDIDFRLGWRTTAWYAVVAAISLYYALSRTAARRKPGGMDVCFLCLPVLWLFSAVMSGNARSMLVPQDISLGALAVYWLGRTCGESDEGIEGVMGTAVAVYAAACIMLAWVLGAGGSFGNVNFLACYLGLSILAALVPVMRMQDAVVRRCLLVALVVTAVYTIALGSRGATLPLALGLAVILGIRYAPAMSKRAGRVRGGAWWKVAACTAVAAAIAVAAVGAYAARPYSVNGRVLLWRVGLTMLEGHAWFGAGQGSFGRTYNIALAEYMTAAPCSPLERMSASGSYHALNEWLEHFVERGVVGIIPYAVFYGFVLYYAGRALRRAWRDGLGTWRCDAGMACVVLMMMACMTYSFPSRIAQCVVVWAGALGILVTLDERAERKECNGGNGRSVKTSILFRAFWLGVFAVHVVAFAASVPVGMAVDEWRAAERQRAKGDVAGALERYRGILPALGWNGRFLASYGDALSHYSTTPGNPDDPEKTALAIALYEKARSTHPDPYMLDHLALAYLQLAGGTNWPVKVQTRHAPDVLIGKGEEPPADMLGRGDCVERAIGCWTQESCMLPWRLTPKYCLADVYRQIGDTNSAVKYARLVVETPMKQQSDEGVALKRQALRMLNDLGVACDDPGVVVFDMWDRKTWNEGRWQ